ncbi:MAG: peptide chain release factor [bacterium]|jgi:peptide chain release factor
MKNWIQITSGRGPVECCWVVAQFVQYLEKIGKKEGFDVTLLSAIQGEKNTLKSALLAISGHDTDKFCKKWEGVILWIGQSPFRSNHKRKNWFIGVQAMVLPQKSYFLEQDLKFEAFRASGPGGQHVNKSETAIRITHKPTSITVVAQEERSQFLNKKLGIVRLMNKIDEVEQQKQNISQKEQWALHNSLERGNAKYVFEGKTFKLNSRSS